MIHLGVNIDHVATLRQARYRDTPKASNVEPDPVEAALVAERAGAHGITAHLRLDRRHIVDEDIYRLRSSISTRLNFEMGNSPEIVEIALKVRPYIVCLVPENRQEVTTEGGLDCVGQLEALRPTMQRIQAEGTLVSLFIDPDLVQIEAAATLGAEYIELHTGAFANASGDEREQEIEKLIIGAERAHALGLKVNAGHGINYDNVKEIRRIPHLDELNIGHSIVSRAVFTGLDAAVREMLRLMND